MWSIQDIVILLLTISHTTALDQHWSTNLREPNDSPLQRRIDEQFEPSRGHLFIRTPPENEFGLAHMRPATAGAVASFALNPAEPTKHIDLPSQKSVHWNTDKASLKENIAHASERARRQGPRETRPTPDVTRAKANVKALKTVARRTRLASERQWPQAGNMVAASARHDDAMKAKQNLLTGTAAVITSGQQAVHQAKQANNWAEALKHMKTIGRAIARNGEVAGEANAVDAKFHRDEAVIQVQNNPLRNVLPNRGYVALADARYRTMVGRYRHDRKRSKDLRGEISGSDTSDSERSFSDVPRSPSSP